MASPFLTRVGRAVVGALRHRIVIEGPVDADDDAGGVTRAYAPRETVWASIETIAANAAWDDNRPGARLTHRIQIRWRADIDTAMRFRLGARVFWIRSVADADAHRRRLSVMVEEHAP